jgi:selenocysteine lyase/cysteine desulfurase
VQDPQAQMDLSEAATHFSAQATYLNTAAMGLPPRRLTQALHDGIERWARGELGTFDAEPHVARARGLLARLVNVPTESVAIGATISSLVGLVASAVPRGAEVLCAQEDFASLLFPFLCRQQAGEIRVKLVPLAELVDAIGAGTGLVAVSAVQSADGRVFDRKGLVQACRHFEVPSLVDATQAVGWLPFDASEFDYVAVNTYKWLLAPRGSAFLYVRDPDALQPNSAGWYAGEDTRSSMYGPPLRLAADARRFDTAPAWLPWMGCSAALDFVAALDIESVYRHDVELAALFLERAGLSPQPPSAIVSIQGAHVAEALRASNIVASSRGGATRLSFHFYNTREQAVAAADRVRAVR